MAAHVGINNTPCAFQRLARFPSCNTAFQLRIGRVCNTVKAIAERRDNLDHLQRVTHVQPQPQQKKKTGKVSIPGMWERFPSARTVQQMMETMDRIVEDPLASGDTWPSIQQRVRDGYKQGRTPWAIMEKESEFKVRFDMPGMTRNDVKVWIEDKNMLVFKAEKVVKKKGENGSPVEEDEWPHNDYGKYSSRIALPENIEMEKIKAEVKDGVMYLTIPKATTSSKVVNINVE